MYLKQLVTFIVVTLFIGVLSAFVIFMVFLRLVHPVPKNANFLGGVPASITPPKATVALEYKDDGFFPKKLVVKDRKNVVVKFFNNGKQDVAIRTKEKYPMLDLAVMHAGESRYVTLSIPGTYHLYNTLNASQTADLIISNP